MSQSHPESHSGSSDASTAPPHVDVTDAAPIDVTDGATSAGVEVIEDEIEIVDDAPRTFTQKHPVFVYTLLRFGLLLVAGAVCYLLGARDILLIVLAFFISAIVSFIVLAPQRDLVGQRTGSYFRRMNDRIEASKTAEDDLIDSAADFDERPANADDADKK
ncbi:MAG: DUF4229 domain-containing protein [Candidatus Nanopelagicales bacterium]